MLCSPAPKAHGEERRNRRVRFVRPTKPASSPEGGHSTIPGVLRTAHCAARRELRGMHALSAEGRFPWTQQPNIHARVQCQNVRQGSHSDGPSGRQILSIILGTVSLTQCCWRRED